MKTISLLLFTLLIFTSCTTAHKEVTLASGEIVVDIICAKSSKCIRRANEICFGKKFKVLKNVASTKNYSDANSDPYAVSAAKSSKFTMRIQCVDRNMIVEDQSNDVIFMKNGDVYRGKILEVKMNKFVQLRMNNGNEKRIQFNKIKEFKKE